MQILNVHLEDMQRINFRERDRLDIIVNIPEKKKTTLTEWFVYNNENSDGRHLTYLNFPSEFVWYPNSKQWRRRQIRTKKSLERLTYVHPSSGDLFYFRMLLCHQKGCKSPDEVRTVQKGFKSPDEVRTVNGQMLPTFRAACEALDFGLQSPPRHLLKDLQNKLLIEEKNYKLDLLKQDAAQSVPKLNHDQKTIYDLIIGASLTKQQELLFVYSHGGTDKTILWKTIISYLRSEGKIVLAVASSGIASLLLPEGRTTHSRFKRKNDRIRRRFSPNVASKKGVKKEELIVSSIAESYLWWHFRICTLKENMRLQISGLTNKERKHSETFAKWLLDVGDSKLGEPEEEDQGSSWITIPPEYSVENDETSLSILINFICDNTTLKTPTAGSLQEKAIVYLKNTTADDVNAKILSNIEGQSKIYLSYDEAIPMGSVTSETELLYPTEYLNTITFPGLPPYELELKVGSSIILLRNVNLLGDYLGCIRSIGDVTPFGDANTGQKYLRKVEIENLDGNILEFTMWDEVAKQFNKQEIQKLTPPIIIVVSSCQVTKYRDPIRPFHKKGAGEFVAEDILDIETAVETHTTASSGEGV
ncbi:DNA helicase [Tanacetum coccineum]